MIFEGLAEKLQNTFSKLKGKGKLNEQDVIAAMREVKMALLEADVNFKVVKDFIAKVKERAVGDEVLESLTPGQHVIKIVKDELTHIMGDTQSKIDFSNKPPTIIMMAGLQGAGKTTTCGKLAKLLKKQGKRPLLVACDVYRPAAINQLETVGKQVEVPVFSLGDKEKPVTIAKESIIHAEKNGNDVVIIDTAGRLHIDSNLMNELKEIDQQVKPHEKLLVLDSMTGQDAVNVAKEFNETIEINGVILTKLDGDTRGGAALSIRGVTDKPIKFVGMGEKLDELEAFHPDRMASRILGMGDMLSLIEKAESSFDQKKAREMEEKLRTQQFTFEDFLDQLEQIRNMGPIGDMLNMLPGMPSKQMKNLNVDEKELNHIQAIIQSMTRNERTNPSIINGSRRKRIAAGSGTSVQQVNKLIKQFEQTRKMMKQFSGSGMDKLKKKGGKFNMPFFG